MKYEWILDVLKDLQNFTSANGMHQLSMELDDLKLRAALEIAKKQAMEKEKKIDRLQ